MATLPANVDGEYGISANLAGYTIESAVETESPVREQVHDQKNRVAKELHYDTRYDLKLTVRGAARPNAENGITYDSKKYIVDSVEKAGQYNGLLRYNINAHRFTNCDTATKIS